MRIDLYGPAAADSVSAARTGPTAAAEDQLSASAPPQDTATLSSGTESVRLLATEALKSATTRASNVEALRQAVQGNTYAVDPSAIAEAILRNHM
jgi:flagellar biosynthesis anti-sigma factor FlgM